MSFPLLLPLGLVGEKLLTELESPPVPERAPAFGISTDQQNQLESAWTAAAGSVTDIAVDALSSVTGTNSATLAALRDTHLPTTNCLASISARLSAMSTALGGFNTQVEGSDTRSAALFDEMEER